MLFIAQGIAGAGVLQSYRRRDIARVAAFDILTVVRVHLQDSADTLIVVLVGVVHRVPALMVPEYTRKKHSLPTKGSVIILNARAENGSSSEEWRTTSSSVSGLIP